MSFGREDIVGSFARECVTEGRAPRKREEDAEEVVDVCPSDFAIGGRENGMRGLFVLAGWCN